MKKKLLVALFAALFLTIVFSGCFEEKKETAEQDNNNGNSIVDYSVPSAITSLTYDSSKLEVYNINVITYGLNGSTKEIIGEGFLPIPDSYDSGSYWINYTIKNIAGYELKKVEGRKNYYDKKDIWIMGGTGYHNSICDGCESFNGIGYDNTSYKFEEFDHMTLELVIIEDEG